MLGHYARVVDKETRTPNNSDSDGDNSSDGVEDDFRVDAMQEASAVIID
jgi:hypothetical protein